MANENTAYITLPGSDKQKPKGVNTGAINEEEVIQVTLRLRRKSSIQKHLESGRQISRAEYESMFGAADEDIDKITAFAKQHNLSVENIYKERRSVMLKGSIKNMQVAFRVSLSVYTDNGITFRARQGEISIPADLKDIVTGVFGLDNRPAAHAMFQYRQQSIVNPNKVSQSYNPNQLATIYNFPANVTGKGQCIGIIELGGGYKTKDLSTYFSTLKIKKPTVKAVKVDGGKNSPTNANSADGEVMLDIEVAGCIAPAAKIAVYFSPNTDEGFLNAVTTAIHDTKNKLSVISISWGAAEVNWTQQSLNSFNEAFESAAALGVTICVAAGDAGSADRETDGKVHADFPASSPYVLACGGTSLQTNGDTISSETVWHDSDTSAGGGGVSEFFAVPDYQQKTVIPASASTGFKGRGLPDVAANADPETGYTVRVDGEDFVIGGTSAVAPLMAGLIALMNEKNKAGAGFINPKLYSTPGLCRDITKGNNITTSTKKGYTAAKGWDACTGWGVFSGY